MVAAIRQGATLGEAVGETVDRSAGRSPKGRDVYASFVAIRADGVTGAGSMRGGFHQALTRNGKTEVIPVPAFNDRNTDDERR